MSKHSPGPWRWDRMREELVDGNGRPMGRRLSEADGNFAAAAPELLAALKRMVTPGFNDSEDARALIRSIENGE